MAVGCAIFLVGGVASMSSMNGAALAIAILGAVLTGAFAIRAFAAFCVRFTDREIEVRSIFRTAHIPISTIERAYAGKRVVGGRQLMKVLIIQTRDGETRAFRGFGEFPETAHGPVERVIEEIESRTER
jgi:hypothetical protein